MDEVNVNDQRHAAIFELGDSVEIGSLHIILYV